MKKILFSSLILLFALTNCVNNVEDLRPDDPEPTPPGTPPVDYQTQIQTIFKDKCSTCHIGGDSSGGMKLDSYDDLRRGGNNYGANEIVVPGNPNASGIVDKVEPNPDKGSRMPTNGKFLSNDQINLIKRWIDEGAKEDTVGGQQKIVHIQK